MSLSLPSALFLVLLLGEGVIGGKSASAPPSVWLLKRVRRFEEEEEEEVGEAYVGMGVSS